MSGRDVLWIALALATVALAVRQTQLSSPPSSTAAQAVAPVDAELRATVASTPATAAEQAPIDSPPDAQELEALVAAAVRERLAAQEAERSQRWQRGGDWRNPTDVDALLAELQLSDDTAAKLREWVTASNAAVRALPNDEQFSAAVLSIYDELHGRVQPLLNDEQRERFVAWRGRAQSWAERSVRWRRNNENDAPSSEAAF